jgi:hypothetical protein
MQRIPVDVVSRLKLEEAVRDEALAEEMLIPRVPGAAELGASAASFADWLAGQLKAGMPTGRGLVVSAEKPVNGSRPVALWGFAERVAYRALTDLLAPAGSSGTDRTGIRYLEFVQAPVVYAEQRGNRTKPEESSSLFVTPWPHDAIVRYVVIADLAAFYDYIDHDILARELLIRTGEHTAIECLMDLLGEVQGRRYGLPQLLGPSDRLSNIYAARVLRAVRRRNWAAWRFNDDFRIAVDRFEDTKNALDDLAAAARDNGLVLNESKTRTPTFFTYWEQNFLSQVDDNTPAAGANHDPVDLVADYTEGARDTDPQWALDTLSSLVTPADGQTAPTGLTDLRGLDRLATRSIRRALLRLADSTVPDAPSVLPKIADIVRFAGSTTPNALLYLQAMAAVDRPAVVSVIRDIIDRANLSNWQRICLIRAISDLGLLTEAPLVDWVQTHRGHQAEPAVRAEAALALAGVNRIDAEQLVLALDQEPSALACWYLTALRLLHDRRAIPGDMYDAVRDEGGLHAAILAAR